MDWRRRGGWLIGLGMAMLLILLPRLVLARAGGGESYGGGSDSGGSSGGDGGGEFIFLILRLLFELCIYYPQFGIPLVIVVIVGFIVVAQFGNAGYVSHTIRRGAVAETQNNLQAAVGDLTQRDPRFDGEQFCSRASAAFLKIQSAWSQQDLTPARPFISDGVRERFSLQIEIQQAEGYRNPMENVVVRECRIIAAATDALLDTLHVLIRATAKDYRVDLESGRRVGTAYEGEFAEVWSFHRRREAKTLTEAGSLEGHCPQCGSPVEIVDRATCPACGVVVNSGVYDWVLTEITQESEWRVPQENQSLPGIVELRRRDPQFCPQHVEDRVSVMFWRLRAAEFFGDPKRARSVVTDEFGRQLKHRLAAGDGGAKSRKFWKDMAVGKVELLAADPAATENTNDDEDQNPSVTSLNNGSQDRLRVLVRWSGIEAEGDPRGSNSVVRNKAIYSQIFVLYRNVDVKSSPEATFSAVTCAKCGGPMALGEDAACPYCGVPLTDGGYDWVLDSITPFTSDYAYRQPSRGPARGGAGNAPDISPPLALDAEMSLAILAQVMLVDNELDPKEMKALAALAKRRGLTSDQLASVIEAAQQNEIELPVPRDTQQATRFLQQLVAASLADGNVSSAERNLLVNCAQKMNLSFADVTQEIAKQRATLYQQARSAIRTQKKNRNG